MNVPPPPPPPVSPLDHIVEMAKKNATFYFEGTQITSDKAIEIIKKNNDLNIQTTGSSSNNPQVKISTKPITFNSDETKAYYIQQKTTLRLMLFDPPNLGPANSSQDPKELVELLYNQSATFWNEQTQISKKDALKLIEKYDHFMIDTTQTPHNKPSIVFDVVIIK